MRFDPEKSLFDLPIVRKIAATTLFSASLAIFIISCTSSLQFQAGYEGINNLIDIFKIPLGMLAIGLSLVGLCGANHRSEQTRRQIERSSRQIDLSTQQIESTKSQNYFSNYYKHAEEFSKLCERAAVSVKIESAQRLHTKLFPKAEAGDFKVTTSAIEEFRVYGNFIRNTLLDIAGQNSFHELWTLQNLNHSFAKKFWAKPVIFEKGGSFMELPQGNLRIPSGSPQAYIEAHLLFIRGVDEIFAFDTTYQSPRIISKLCNLGLGYVPASVGKPLSINFPGLIDE